MNEQKVISALVNSREAYEAVNEQIDETEFSTESNLIIRHVRDYYGRDTAAAAVDLDLLVGSVKRQLTNPKHSTAIETVLRNLPACSPANVAKELLEVRRHSVGLKLSSALAGARGRDQVEKLLELYNKLFSATEQADEKPQEEVSGLDLSTLVEKHFKRDNLVQFAPTALNERLDGGAKPGHHILVFAPTEMGKTLFAVNSVAGFIAQHLRVLYIGNEDPIADIQMRLASNLTGLTKHEIEADPEAAMAALAGTNVENFNIVEMSPGTFPRISKLIEKYQPRVLVLDQLRNIDVRSENRTQALEKAATEARNLAKRCGIVVVSITQAGDSASGRRLLTRGDVDGSNVGIPGQCDVMVGIGATEEEEARGHRTISLPKNKLGGRHDHFTCQFETQYSRIVQHGAANDANFLQRRRA